MFKKGLKGNLYIKNGFKIEIKEENKDILKKASDWMPSLLKLVIF